MLVTGAPGRRSFRSIQTEFCRSLSSQCATAGPPSKRQRATLGTEDFDDEELLALATTQMQEPAGHKSAAASAAMQSAILQTSNVNRSALPTHFNSTQEALDEEQEIAELVRLANSTVPQSDHAAAQPSMDEMPESSTAAADRMQAPLIVYQWMRLHGLVPTSQESACPSHWQMEEEHSADCTPNKTGLSCNASTGTESCCQYPLVT